VRFCGVGSRDGVVGGCDGVGVIVTVIVALKSYSGIMSRVCCRMLSANAVRSMREGGKRSEGAKGDGIFVVTGSVGGVVLSSSGRLLSRECASRGANS